MSMAYDVRTLYRYTPNGLVEPNRGGAVRKWSRTRAYIVSMYPRECSRTPTEFGFDDEVTWLVIIDNTKDFKLGDRLGSYKEQQYEVTKVRTYKTSQQMEVREIARDHA